MHEQRTSRWVQFWEHGGWWRAIALTAIYFVLYEGLSLLFLPLASRIDDPNTGYAILVSYALPVLIGALLLVAFIASVGWFGQIFGSQPIRGRGWMWIAIAIVLLFNILRFATIDYSRTSLEFIATWLLAGLLIGFAEEVLTRGIVVNMLRRARYREISVALISSAVFAGLHSGNLLSGQPVIPTLVQLVYTFFFGILMYLALRVTGTIIAPILLHASTDPSIFVQAQFPLDSPLSTMAGFGNVVAIIVGLVLVFVIRGRVETERHAHESGAFNARR